MPVMFGIVENNQPNTEVSTSNNTGNNNPSLYTFDYPFLQYGVSANTNSGSDTDSDIEQDNTAVIRAQSTSWISVFVEATQIILRNSANAIPALFRESDNWNVANIAGGIVGLVIGSSVKAKFGTAFTVITCLSLTGRVLLDLGIITVNWHRVQELQQQMPLLNETIQKTPSLFSRIATIPLGAFFMGGILFGVRYG